MRRALLPMFAVLFCFAPLAVGQDESPAALRREIDRLTEEISALEARLERSQDRIDTLTAENSRLRAALSGENASDGGGDGDESGDEDTGVAELPEDPHACPDSMRAALERSWDEEFAGVDVSDDQQSRRYLRDVRSWAGKTRRDMRGKFDWRVTVLAAREQGRSRTVATLQVLDAQGRELGEPAEVEVRGSAARTILQAAQGAVFLVEGNVDVDIDVDAREGAAGDDIGPYLRTTIEYVVTRARYE